MTIPAPHAARSRKRAKIIRFPLARQWPLVSKLARQMAGQMPARAEKTLRAELQRRIDALHRQGLSDQAVEREVRALGCEGQSGRATYALAGASHECDSIL